MQPYQQRVVDECNELSDKSTALYNFLASSQFEILAKDEQQRLKMQYYAMKVYQGILEQRIVKF